MRSNKKRRTKKKRSILNHEDHKFSDVDLLRRRKKARLSLLPNRESMDENSLVVEPLDCKAFSNKTVLKGSDI